MSPDIYLAYDGSVNGDWVARYALNMTFHADNSRLALIHIKDGSGSRENIKAKIAAVEQEARLMGLKIEPVILPLSGNVTSSLISAVPNNSNSLCVCGMRMASRGKGFLTNTVAGYLLRHRKFDVMAIRVVDPGLLGAPRNLLFPLSGHPRGFLAAMHFFKLMAPEARALFLLRVMTVNAMKFQYMSDSKAKALHQHGAEYINHVLTRVRQELSSSNIHIDGKVIVSDDWMKSILIQAGKLKVQMIIMGASDRNLPSRYFYGSKIEQLLRETPCDVGIYRKT